ncbi:3-hydroxyacyl-CoA dehydrogenase family protein [Peredibacter sp. HCB2-198]|uniref:3-hydroxyacyl-CoA dehydrogenase family protein n=1 Tax=Peredibacter sp. HCB2-198 TaxID=3383025 RepID=UPI0038B5B0F7
MKSLNINKVVIIGAGTMGSGIAQWFTQQLCSVELVDNSEAQLQKALKDIHTSWDKLAEKGKLSNAAELKKLISIKMIDQVAKDADLVVEAIIENLEIKRELFKKLDAYFEPHTILASNTSSFPIHLMAEAVKRKDKFLGLHFFNPATIMKLVEVIKGKDSSEQICRDLYAWFDSKDKKPAFCKDSPGFIVNRVARNFYGEPLRIVDTENEAKEKEVDAILKEVGGFKMGPFELMDLIGIDVNYSVTCSVWEAYNKEPRFAPHKLQKQMVDEKRFGRKSKRGFYKYD